MDNLRIKRFFYDNGVWLGLFLLILLLALATQGDFFSARNLTNLIRQVSINGILAVGMTLIILTGGIDLSIGSIVALCGVVIGISQVNWHWSDMGTAGAVASLGLSLAIGTLIGFINGGLIVLLKIAPFIVTLGGMVILRGFAMIFSGGGSISPMGEALNSVSSGYLSIGLSWVLIGVSLILFGLYFIRSKIQKINFLFPAIAAGLFCVSFLGYKGVPYLALFLILVLLVFSFVLNQTVFGRSIYALGSNEKAAFWAGVKIRKTMLGVYTIMGFLSGLASYLLVGRLNGADPNAGQLFELDAIAAVVIGGTSLKGGTGTVMGTIAGALMIGVLNNGMDLLGVPSFYQMVFKGIIIIVAVSLDRGNRQS